MCGVPMDSASDYLDGVVSAVSRIGTLIVTMWLISGLILVIFYVDHFSVNNNLYEVARSTRDVLAKEESVYSYQIKAIDVHQATARPDNADLLANLRPYCADQYDLQLCRQKLFDQLSLKDVTEGDLPRKIGIRCEPPATDLLKCRQTLIDDRSVVSFRVMRIDNEMKLVNLGHVKLPFLGYEIPTNDASVVLGFFLVIFASVTVITVHHLRGALTDKDVAEKINENVTLLRARLILIYAPLNGGFMSYLTLASFFMPSLVMALVAIDQLVQFWVEIATIRAQNLFGPALIQSVLLTAMALFLVYVAISLMRGWRQIGVVVNQPSEPSFSMTQELSPD
jgi:ABC-type multidrug transport system fused ATPase/permease subunit